METKIITRGSADYPELLANIPEPPQLLYYRGDIRILSNKCVSVAGSRRASPEGICAAEVIGKRLAECGATVVSGLAEGADAAAHRGALSAGGHTVAVLANGMDRYYPAVNKDLQREIEANGLLITEYDDSIPAKRFHFPRRNRIISGLSEVTVITEAALRSGSLITAEAAAEQGRAVYAVAGNFTKECCAGTNHLIADGARPIVDVNQFLLDIGLCPPDGTALPDDLSDEETMIYDVVRRYGEATTDEISRETLIPPRIANGIITVMEMKGYLRTDMGKVFLNINSL